MPHLPVDFASILFKLLPQGEAISEEDTRLRELLGRIGQEFARVFDLLNALLAAISPEPGTLLFPRWQGVTGDASPSAFLRAKGQPLHHAGRDYVLSNTRGHFERLAPSAEVSFGINSVSFKGIQNARHPLRAGSSINRRLSSFKRDQDLINRIEGVKHAHVVSYYEEQNA